MEKRKVFLAVLSSREGGRGIRDETACNVEEAVFLERFCRKNRDIEATIIFMAGAHRYDSLPTIASRMEGYARLVSGEEHAPPCIVNREDLTVWGTGAEVRWAFEEAKKHATNPHMVFVTSRWSRFEVWCACTWYSVRNRTILVPGRYPTAAFARL